MAYMDYSKDLEGKTCTEIFSEILSRQVFAMMFHDQMAVYFDFLGLCGFKRMHEYQYFSETVAYRCTERFFISHHNEIALVGATHNPGMIPTDWLRHNRFDVTAAIKKRSVKEAFEEYREWEQNTVEALSTYIKALKDKGMPEDANFIEGILEETSKELKCLEGMMLKMNSVEYDLKSIEDFQWHLHKKYKKKLKKIAEEL